jgi:hypothetical protein
MLSKIGRVRAGSSLIALVVAQIGTAAGAFAVAHAQPSGPIPRYPGMFSRPDWLQLLKTVRIGQDAPLLTQTEFTNHAFAEGPPFRRPEPLRGRIRCGEQTQFYFGEEVHEHERRPWIPPSASVY